MFLGLNYKHRDAVVVDVVYDAVIVAIICIFIFVLFLLIVLYDTAAFGSASAL